MPSYWLNQYRGPIFNLAFAQDRPVVRSRGLYVTNNLDENKLLTRIIIAGILRKTVSSNL